MKSLIFGALLIAATPTGVDLTTSLVGRPPDTFSRSRCCLFTGTVDDVLDGLAASSHVTSLGEAARLRGATDFATSLRSSRLSRCACASPCLLRDRRLRRVSSIASSTPGMRSVATRTSIPRGRRTRCFAAAAGELIMSSLAVAPFAPLAVRCARAVRACRITRSPRPPKLAFSIFVRVITRVVRKLLEHCSAHWPPALSPSSTYSLLLNPFPPLPPFTACSARLPMRALHALRPTSSHGLCRL